MSFKMPSTQQVRELGDSLGIGVTENYANSFLDFIKPFADGYRLIASPPDDLPEIKYPRGGLCLSEIKSGHIRDAIRRGPGGKEYALPSLRCAIGEHPCPRPSACASHYSSERKNSESGVDVPRPGQ
jgi:hypothetical protein